MYIKVHQNKYLSYSIVSGAKNIGLADCSEIRLGCRNIKDILPAKQYLLKYCLLYLLVLTCLVISLDDKFYRLHVSKKAEQFHRHHLHYFAPE